MVQITDDIKIVTRVIDIELNKVCYQIREDLKQDILYKLCKIADAGPITYIKSLTRILTRGTIVDYYRRCNVINAATRPAPSDATFTAVSIELGYEIAELRADLLNNKDLFSSSEIKVLDLMINKDMGGTESADQIRKHKSVSSQAISKVRMLVQ